MRSYQRDRSPSYVAARRAYSSSVSSRQGPIPGGASQSFVAFVGMYVMCSSSRSDRDPLVHRYVNEQFQADRMQPAVFQVDQRARGAATEDDRARAGSVEREIVAEGVDPLGQEGSADVRRAVLVRIARPELRAHDV